jgi:hypothetical protein
MICSRFGVTIDIDLFASDVHHVTKRFISAFYVPGCIAVQSFAQDWSSLLSDPSATAWAFPPTKTISVALTSIEYQHINAIFILPTRLMTNDWIQVHNIQGRLSEPFQLPRQADLCCPSLRVPAGAINPILMGLTTFYIQSI